MRTHVTIAEHVNRTRCYAILSLSVSLYKPMKVAIDLSHCMAVANLLARRIFMVTGHAVCMLPYKWGIQTAASTTVAPRVKGRKYTSRYAAQTNSVNRGSNPAQMTGVVVQFYHVQRRAQLTCYFACFNLT
jgi:hypothetical protein